MRNGTKKLTGPLKKTHLSQHYWKQQKKRKSDLDEVQSIYQQPLPRHKEAATPGTLQNQQPQVLDWSNPYAYKHWQHLDLLLWPSGEYPATVKEQVTGKCGIHPSYIYLLLSRKQGQWNKKGKKLTIRISVDPLISNCNCQIELGWTLLSIQGWKFYSWNLILLMLLTFQSPSP